MVIAHPPRGGGDLKAPCSCPARREDDERPCGDGRSRGAGPVKRQQRGARDAEADAEHFESRERLVAEDRAQRGGDHRLRRLQKRHDRRRRQVESQKAEEHVPEHAAPAEDEPPAVSPARPLALTRMQQRHRDHVDRARPQFAEEGERDRIQT